MSNHITIELCANDQARIDKLIDRLEAVANLTTCLIDAIKPPTYTVEVPKKIETDELTKKLQAVVDRAKNAAEATEAQTLTTTPPKEETPTAAEEAKPTPAKTVTRNELGAKVRELMTKGFKEETKAIVRDYAQTVPGVPDDKVTECYKRLVALEG